MNTQSFGPNRFNLLPEVVKNLLIINGLFFLATYVLQNTYGIDLIEKLGLHYMGSDKFQPYQIITHIFMHGSFMHIFSNMFMLWMFGNILENHWGGKRFLIYYMITGFGAAFIHYVISYYMEMAPVINAINDYIAAPSLEKLNAFSVEHKFLISQFSSAEIQQAYAQFYNYTQTLSINPADSTALNGTVNFMETYKTYFLGLPNMVGASGAVFGTLLAFGMLFPNQVIYLYFAIPIKAKYFVILYGLFELYAGVSSNPGDNVAHYAHLGGMLFGFILIKYWNKNDRQNFY